MIRDPCIVYSLGSNGNMAFEKDLLRINPSCKIFIFDKDNFGMSDWFTPEQIKNNVKFTKAFISGYENLKNDPPVYNLLTIMNKYNHNHIDILKVDIEGNEYDLIEGPMPSIGQFLVEFHFLPDLMKGKIPKIFFPKIIDKLESHGFRLFHKEVNKGAYDCMEMSFIQKDWTPDKKFYKMK